MKLVILNGPPRSGKDTLADYLCYRYSNAVHLKFADEVKQKVHRMYGLHESSSIALEKTKDIPCKALYYLTPREAYIGLSELYIKPMHGKDFLGRVLVEKIKQTPRFEDRLFVVSDGGFMEELEALLKVIKSKCISVARIHRPGCDFKNDSRRYLTQEELEERNVVSFDLYNLGEKVDFLKDSEITLRQKLDIDSKERTYPLMGKKLRTLA